MLSRADSRRTRVIVSDVTQLNDRAQRVKLRAPEGYSWLAGEYLTISKDLEGKQVAYYSIASAPKRDSPGLLELVVSGASFCGGVDAKIGDEYWLAPAEGKLKYTSVLTSSRLFLVGMGTGIAPMRAMVQALAVRSDRPSEITLIQGSRLLEECLFHDEFSALDSILDYRPVLSQPPAGWSGRKGRVQHHLLDTPVRDVNYCVCGSRKMVTEVKELLQSRGLDLANFYAEGNG